MVTTTGARKATNTGNVVALNTRTKASSTTAINRQTGGPTDGGDSWRDSVETRLGELRTDMRHMFIGGLVAIAALLGAGWVAYKDATSQMRQIAVQQENLSGKLDTMDARMTGKFDALGVRLDDQAAGKKSDAK